MRHIAETMTDLRRRLDHLVLPTADLAVARQRLSALGFTVAPDGIHPFGTKNCCVFFQDGTYLEPLAIGDADVAEKAITAGNAFVARDAAFRTRRGEEGFSALVFSGDDAEADHRRLVEAGLSAGDMLEFSRDFVSPGGEARIASFRLAFAGEQKSPCFLFLCERINSPPGGRAGLERHDNGVAAISRVVAVSEPAGASARLIAAVATSSVTLCDTGLGVSLANVAVEVVSRAQFAASFGVERPATPGLDLSGIVFGTTDLSATERLLRDRNIPSERREETLIVPPAQGQGATFIFEEI